MFQPRPHIVARIALVGLLLAAGLAAPAAADHEQGTRVEVTGLVTDLDGRPLPDVRVVLRQVRETFSVFKFRRTDERTTPITTTTNARGEYSITFPYDDFYNRFELVAGVPVRGPEGERLSELATSDVTRRVQRNTPVIATLVVENASFVESLREFLAEIDTPDERRIYTEDGRPDKVEITNYADRTEAAWWYFATGRVHRFVDGRLQRTERFDPVRPIG
jgi:hypothetical protein